jgi:hypothetical protein
VTPLATEIGRSDEPRQLTLTDAMRIATTMEIRGVGGSPVETESNYEVVGVNIDRAAGSSGPAWDPASATVAFTFEDAAVASGIAIYLENALSIGYKVEYVGRFNLGGIAVQDASSDPLLGNLWAGLAPFIAGGNPVLASANDTILSPRWEILDENGGTIEASQRGSIRWTTPAQPGTYTIALTLSDGVDLFTNRLPVVVQQRDAEAGG